MAVVLVTASVAYATPDADDVVGVWEGESTCTVRDSPCHDEHVIYTVKPDASGGGFSTQADKVVNGERQNMGTLPCRYDAKAKRFTCVTEGAKPADWVFAVSGGTMTGTLTLRADHQLFRRIRVQRAEPAKKP